MTVAHLSPQVHVILRARSQARSWSSSHYSHIQAQGNTSVLPLRAAAEDTVFHNVASNEQSTQMTRLGHCSKVRLAPGSTAPAQWGFPPAAGFLSRARYLAPDCLTVAHEGIGQQPVQLWESAELRSCCCPLCPGGQCLDASKEQLSDVFFEAVFGVPKAP